MPNIDERRYQVFVSSTFKDLEPERQRVLQAILEMKAFPAGMELFPSADDEQWEFIKREIESSDYYIVLVAGKYGSLAPDGISFTEKEYDYAIEIGKPVMVFLFHDLGELKGSLLESEPARRANLDAFRAKVAKGKLIKHFKNPDDLKGLIFQALVHAFNFRPKEGWVRAVNARRMEDLEQLNELQRRLSALEKENSALRQAAKDPSEFLSQEGDTATWIVPVTWTATGGPGGREVLFEKTWDELLVICFDGKAQLARSYIVHSRLQKVISQEVSQLLESEGIKFGSVSAVVTEVVAGVSLQLQALGYMTVVDSQGPAGDHWTLTSAGLLRLALLCGRTRSASE